MLSILIPIYNQDVTTLARQLLQSIDTIDVDVEIVLFDDGSDLKWKSINRSIEEHSSIQYVESSYNLGRSGARNQLAKLAKFDTLLFLDGDSLLIDDQLILNYLSHKEDPIVNGGRIYQSNEPDRNHRLHWKYGREKEVVSLNKRKKHPVRYFHSNNFLCKKKVILQFPFDESKKGYGYEDLVWATEISKEYKIKHIHNPIIHDGIELNDDFLRKTVVAVQNLKAFEQDNAIVPTPLTRYSKLLKSTKLDRLFMRYYKNNIDKITKDLHGEDPSLINFQLYKLYHYLIL